MEEYKNKEVLEQLISDGLTIPQMAVKLSCGTTTVKRWLKKYGLKTIVAQNIGKSVITNCSHCSKEIKKTAKEIRNSKSGELFCSQSCAASYNNKVSPKRKLSRKCSVENCFEVVIGITKKFCKKHYKEFHDFRGDYLLNKTLGEYRIYHYRKGTPKASIYRNIRDKARRDYKDLAKSPCVNCGYSLHVEICHIKGLAEFTDKATISEINHKDNIIQLCRNCHWELDNGYLSIDDIKR